jgi:hypothetical protein
MHLLSKTLGKTYRHHGGEGPGLLGPVSPGEGSCDYCREIHCTKDHLQCLVSMMQLKCED